MSAFGMAFAFWPWLALVLAILVQVCLALGVCLWHLDCLWWRMLCLPLAWLLLSGLGLPWCLPSWCRSVLLWGCASGTWTAYGGEYCACLWHGFCFLALACLGACHLGAGLSCSGGVPLAPGLPMVENTVLAFGMAFAFWPWLALVLAILVQVCLALGVCLWHLDCLWWRILCLPLAWLLLSGLGLPWCLPSWCRSVLLWGCASGTWTAYGGECCACLWHGCHTWHLPGPPYLSLACCCFVAGAVVVCLLGVLCGGVVFQFKELMVPTRGNHVNVNFSMHANSKTGHIDWFHFPSQFLSTTSKPRGLCMFVIGFHACPLEAGSYGCGEAIVPSAWWLGPGSFADRSIPCQYRQQDLTSSGKIILLSELWGECSVLTARITFFSTNSLVLSGLKLLGIAMPTFVQVV